MGEKPVSSCCLNDKFYKQEQQIFSEELPSENAITSQHFLQSCPIKTVLQRTRRSDQITLNRGQKKTATLNKEQRRTATLARAAGVLIQEAEEEYCNISAVFQKVIIQHLPKKRKKNTVTYQLLFRKLSSLLLL